MNRQQVVWKCAVGPRRRWRRWRSRYRSTCTRTPDPGSPARGMGRLPPPPPPSLSSFANPDVLSLFPSACLQSPTRPRLRPAAAGPGTARGNLAPYALTLTGVSLFPSACLQSPTRPPLRPAAAGPGTARGNLAPCALTLTGVEGEAAAGVAIYKAIIAALDLNCSSDPGRADIK